MTTPQSYLEISTIGQNFEVRVRANRYADGVYTLPAGELNQLTAGMRPEEPVYLSVPAYEQQDVYSFADDRIVCDVRSGRTYVDGKEIAPSPPQFNILSALGRNAGRIVKHELLRDEVESTGREVVTSTIRVWVYRTRTLLGSELGNPNTGAIRTVRDVGYMAVQSLAS